MNERRILIAYASKRGSARKAAECDIVDLKKSPPSNLEQYGTVVLGSGILAGKVYRPLQRFIDEHSEELNDKCICLFITHLEEGDGIEKDFRTAFKEEFLARARAGPRPRRSRRQVEAEGDQFLSQADHEKDKQGGGKRFLELRLAFP